MATHASAEKAARQATKRNARNQAARAHYRTIIKNLRTAVAEKKPKEVLSSLLNETQRVLMKAASKDLIKKNMAARQISRLSALVSKSSK